MGPETTLAREPTGIFVQRHLQEHNEERYLAGLSCESRAADFDEFAIRLPVGNFHCKYTQTFTWCLERRVTLPGDLSKLLIESSLKQTLDVNTSYNGYSCLLPDALEDLSAHRGVDFVVLGLKEKHKFV